MIYLLGLCLVTDSGPLCVRLRLRRAASVNTREPNTANTSSPSNTAGSVTPCRNRTWITGNGRYVIKHLEDVHIYSFIHSLEHQNSRLPCLRPHFSLNIKTKSSKGLILHVAGTGVIPLLAVYLANGKIRMSLGRDRIIQHKEKSNDGNWHRVTDHKLSVFRMKNGCTTVGSIVLFPPTFTESQYFGVFDLILLIEVIVVMTGCLCVSLGRLSSAWRRALFICWSTESVWPMDTCQTTRDRRWSCATLCIWEVIQSAETQKSVSTAVSHIFPHSLAYILTLSSSSLRDTTFPWTVSLDAYGISKWTRKISRARRQAVKLHPAPISSQRRGRTSVVVTSS